MDVIKVLQADPVKEPSPTIRLFNEEDHRGRPRRASRARIPKVKLFPKAF